MELKIQDEVTKNGETFYRVTFSTKEDSATFLVPFPNGSTYDSFLATAQKLGLVNTNAKIRPKYNPPPETTDLFKNDTVKNSIKKLKGPINLDAKATGN